ncbi:hypothetical protein ACIZ62_18890 [Acetobacterium carbinolicum]|uniref:hypothetical protein n=1 Tax=Acetobacterium carbinolicum TaxID=52690 RepID=UPI0039BF709F
MEEYPWSSYDKVIQAYQINSSKLNIEIIKDYFPSSADFVRFSEEENQDDFLEINQKTRWCNAQLTDMLRQNSEYQDLGEQSFEKRTQLIRQIQQETGGSIRQLSRVLGLGKMMVERAVK